MRARLGAAAFIAAVGAQACSLGGFGSHSSDSYYSGGYASDPDPPPPSPPSCVSAAAWERMSALHDDTEASVHELIKCGGLQTRISRTILVIVVASNRALFTPAAYSELVRFAATYGVDLGVPLNRGADGLWTLPLNPTNDSTFSLRFHHPTTHEVITADPFVLDSYVTGATATSTLTIEQMEASLGTRNAITFTWDKPAELATVLNGGAEIPNPFTIQVSFYDLAKWVFGFNLGSGNPVLGPLDSLFDLGTDSSVVLNDERDGTTIAYDIAGLDATLRQIQDRGISYQVNSISAHNGKYSLTGTASDLTYRGGLVGRFVYRVSSPEGDVVITDSYDPSSGLETTWKCP